MVARGKLSVRDEKAPQLLCDSLTPLSEPPESVVQAKKLYIRVPAEGALLEKIKLVFSMFPGEEQAVIVLVDSRKKLGTRCQIHNALVEDLRERLGDENVVVK